MNNTNCKWILVPVGLVISCTLFAATCVTYPVGSAVLDVAGKPMTLKTPQEIDPCVGRLISGKIVVVMRGTDGRTQTREFREGDVIDASAVGVARPGKLLTSLLTGAFVSRPGYSRGPLAHPELFGIPVGDILIPSDDLHIGPVKALTAAGYVKLNFFRQGKSTPILRLELSDQEDVTVPQSLLEQGVNYSWQLQGPAGVQEDGFYVVDDSRRKAIFLSQNMNMSPALVDQIRTIGMLVDAELKFDAVQLYRSLVR